MQFLTAVRGVLLWRTKSCRPFYSWKSGRCRRWRQGFTTSIMVVCSWIITLRTSIISLIIQPTSLYFARTVMASTCLSIRIFRRFTASKRRVASLALIVLMIMPQTVTFRAIVVADLTRAITTRTGYLFTLDGCCWTASTITTHQGNDERKHDQNFLHVLKSMCDSVHITFFCKRSVDWIATL